MIIVKTEITNSVNDNEDIEWKICNTQEEAENFIFDKECDIDVWNYHTSGAQSFRYLSKWQYSITKFLELDFSELTGLKIKDFLKIIKS